MPLYVKGEDIRIIGTFEDIPAIALATTRDPNGNPAYLGESIVKWDEQRPRTRGGERVWVDENHDTWTDSQIEERDE